MISCINCGNRALPKYSLPATNFGSFREQIIFECSNCSLLFKEIDQIEDLLMDYYRNNDGLYKDKIDRNVSSVKWLVDCVLNYKAGGAILDIGCSDGFFLSALPGSFIKFGVEPSKVEMIDRDISQYRDFFENVTFNEQKFEVITVFDVLEHVLKPNQFFEGLSKITGNGALVFLTTPDAKSWSLKFFGVFWRHFLPMEHVIFYNIDSLRLIASNFGFELIESRAFDHKNNLVKSTGFFLWSLMSLSAKAFFNMLGLKGRKLYVEMLFDYRLFILRRVE